MADEYSDCYTGVLIDGVQESQITVLWDRQRGLFSLGSAAVATADFA